MTIGLPKAFFYYRYRHLWETFFRELGCAVVHSGDTTEETLERGAADAASECCLPAKIYLGHVRSLIGRCDYIFVPRLADFGREDEFCVRFFGAADVLRHTYRDIPLLCCDICQIRRRDERMGFASVGRQLGRNRRDTMRAYYAAALVQQRADAQLRAAQDALLRAPLPKVLVAAQPYILNDPLIGKPVFDMIRANGGEPLYSDRFDREACRCASKEITRELYWMTNREAVGSVALYGAQADGVILLTAFPCGGDALCSELVLRRVKDVPVIQIVLDEMRGDAGLQTRIESFMDILTERRRAHGN